MRITKVKVNKETVRFNRHSKYISPKSLKSKKGRGELMGDTRLLKIDDIKTKEFQNSVFNSLVLLEVKPQKNDKDSDKNNLDSKLDALTQVLKRYFFFDDMNPQEYNIRQCAKITETDLKRLLNRKGLNTLNMGNERFEFTDAILEFAETRNLKCFDKAKRWIKAKIEKKKKGISKSIEENRVAFNLRYKEPQLGVSSRKDVLNKLIKDNNLRPAQRGCATTGRLSTIPTIAVTTRLLLPAGISILLPSEI